MTWMPGSWISMFCCRPYSNDQMTAEMPSFLTFLKHLHLKINE